VPEDYKPHILIVEDEAELARGLKRGLEQRLVAPLLPETPTISIATSPSEAKEAFKSKAPSVCILDLNLDESRGSESGLELLPELFSLNHDLRVLVLTGESREDWGVRALERGASSFLQKPANQNHLAHLVKDALEHHALLSKNRLSDKNATTTLGLRSKDRSMLAVIEQFELAINSHLPVLISGETGTGKGFLARLIHEHSKASGQFIRFQPSFGSADLVSSELFGHMKGAFTGAVSDKSGLLEIAKDGSILLDEIDSLPEQTQVSLLEVLQEGVFRPLGSNKDRKSHFRVIAATNSNCQEAIKKRLLREDFFHRLSHIHIELPPLRERPSDLFELAENFLCSFSSEEKLRVHSFSSDGKALLQTYSWPGNIRELKASVESACLRADLNNRGLVTAEDFKLSQTNSTSDHLSASDTLTFREKVRSFELKLVEEALDKHEQNVSRAALELGIDRSQVKRVLARLKT